MLYRRVKACFRALSHSMVFHFCRHEGWLSPSLNSSSSTISSKTETAGLRGPSRTFRDDSPAGEGSATPHLPHRSEPALSSFVVPQAWHVTGGMVRVFRCYRGTLCSPGAAF